MNVEELRGRVQALLESTRGIRNDDTGAIQAVFQGALNVAIMAYGRDAGQLDPLRVWADPKHGFVGSDMHYEAAVAVLQNLAAELDAGLLGDLRGRIAGEVIADFVALAREALHLEEPEAIHVAAVLAAAAFEDAIRRLGEQLAGVAGRPKLGDIIQKLRDAELLAGGHGRQALDLLPFRNDALHADWKNISRPLVESALAFVDFIVRERLG